MEINNHRIENGGEVFVIAEAGVNHNGRLGLALGLIDVAAKAGADAVKFQTFKAEQVVTTEGQMAAYQQKNLGVTVSQQEMLKALELPEYFYPALLDRCHRQNIVFMSTPHGGKKSVDFLEKIGVEAYKIGSGDLTNYILLNRVAQTGKPIILSSGMATLDEVDRAIQFIKSKGATSLAMLHCTSSYPCPPEEVNMASMKTMMQHLDIPVGYSDHTNTDQAAIMSATLGAAVYECHFTLDKSLPGPDHIASASPAELTRKIKAIRAVEKMMGNGSKRPTPSEMKNMRYTIRRSIVVTRDLEVGHIITEDDLEAKRPGDGVSPINYQKFIGRRLNKPLSIDQQLKFNDIDE